MWLGRIGGTGTLALMLFGLTGCEDCYDGSCCGGWLGDYHAPAVPLGLASATGDGEIFLSWLPNQDDDLAGYRVYVSRDPDGPYGRIGDTHRTTFTDHGAVNSRTYFYAVTAYDWCGNESEL